MTKRVTKNKDWAECKVNGVGGTGRTRARTSAAEYPPWPAFVTVQLRGSIPCEKSPRLYNSQTKLLLCIDKYIKGYFDSSHRVRDDLMLASQGVWEWRALSKRCSDIAKLIQKKSDFLSDVEKKRTARTKRERKQIQENKEKMSKSERRWYEQTKFRSQSRGTEHIQATAQDLLETWVRSPLERLAKDVSPHMLVSLWVVCRVLQNNGPHIMHANGTSVVAIDFANSLRSVLWQIYIEPRGSVEGLLDILQAFVEVSPSDLADTLSICSLCTCRTISA